ncbi:MAG: class I SAM-dependent methyltransferase [Pirellulaceae bacterium]
MSGEIDETRDFWNAVADDWRIQVGDDGDANRRLNSDPVLWRMAGDVRGLDVLDAGCGTGYLTGKLLERGAHVVSVDFAPRMIDIARAAHPAGDFRVDSCTELRTLDDGSIDVIVSNYVLMDTPDLEAAVRAFHRVLRPGGAAVLVFSHPCFPQGRAAETDDGGGLLYRWDASYFERQKCVDPPWAQFRSDFIWFHRPLSDYWKAFTTAGFEVVDFEEPRLTADRLHLADSDRTRQAFQTRPCSVAFQLRKR